MSFRYAAAETFQCETRSERADHVVSLGGVTGVPSRALSLHSGEVLCVTGTPNAGGVLEDLRVLQSARGVATPVIELRLLRNGKTLLTVRHSSKQHLEYRPFAVWEQLDVTLEEHSRNAPPKGVATEQWDSRVQRLLLADFRFYDERSETGTARALAVDPEARRLWFSFDFWAGERYAALQPLNAAIARDGFVPISNTRFWFGGALDMALGRVRFGLNASGSKLTTPNLASDATLTTTFVEGGLSVGYDVFRYDYLSVHLSSGIGGGKLGLDPRTAGLSLFEGQYDPEAPGNAGWSYVALPIELGLDYIVPFVLSGRAALVVRFGSRFGWVQQLGGEWIVPGEGPVVGVPALDLSGMRGALVLSLGATTFK